MPNRNSLSLTTVRRRSKTGYDESEHPDHSALGGTWLHRRIALTPQGVRSVEHNQDNSAGKALSSCRKWAYVGGAVAFRIAAGTTNLRLHRRKALSTRSHLVVRLEFSVHALD